MGSDCKQRAAASSMTSSRSNIVAAYNEPFGALNAFWKLPLELQQRILRVACGPPVLDRYTIVGRTTDCTTTMLSLVYAAKVFSPFITPLLYRHVRLTRPSALHAFLRTLSGNPPLGQLVRSLHLGDDKQLPADWWPVEGHHDLADSKFNRLTLQLGGEGRPWRGCPTVELDTDDFHSDPAKANALDEAFQEATSYLNVSLVGPPRGSRHPYVRNDEWCVGIMELRAAMELYYLELLRCEERAGQSVKKSRGRSKRRKAEPPAISYPRLRMGTSSFAIPAESDLARNVFQIDRSQVLKRLASPASPTDSFSHPYLFARSDATWWTRGFRGGPEDDVELPDTNEAGRPATLLSMDHSSATPEAGASRSSSALQACSSLDWSFPPTQATILDYIALAECLVALSPQVRNVSLTGFFTLLAAGEAFSAAQALQFLSIGPAHGAWVRPLQLNHSAIQSVKKLRVCGLVLGEECNSILGDNDALQQLEEFQWSVMRSGDSQHESE